MKFEVLEHTGDVGLKFYGETYRELLGNAVSGTAGLIGKPIGKCRRVRKTVSLGSTNFEDLLLQVLSKVVFSFEVDEILIDSVETFEFRKNGVSDLVLSGCRTGKNFQYHYVLKAPTYYRLEINLEQGYGIVIFDI